MLHDPLRRIIRTPLTYPYNCTMSIIITINCRAPFGARVRTAAGMADLALARSISEASEAGSFWASATSQDCYSPYEIARTGSEIGPAVTVLGPDQARDSRDAQVKRLAELLVELGLGRTELERKGGRAENCT